MLLFFHKYSYNYIYYHGNHDKKSNIGNF